jgi:hypothetical protein
MSNNLEHLERDPGITDRRRHLRIQVPFVLYVELGNGNGGLIPNLSETGFAVQAGTILVGDNFSSLQFQLPESGTWIECAGRLAWQGASKKEAGIEFIDLHEEGRDQIRNWISSQTVSGAVPAEKSNFNGVVETEEPDRRAGSDSTLEQTSPAEFEFSEFFPEEGKLTSKSAAGPDAFEIQNEELKPDSEPSAAANDPAISTESERFEQPSGVYAQSSDRAGNFPSELRPEEPMPAFPALNQGSVGDRDPFSQAKVSISDIPVPGRSSYGEIQRDVLSYAHATKPYRDEFTADGNQSWRPLILTSVIAFAGGLAIAALLIFGPPNFRALVSHDTTPTMDPFGRDARTADVRSLPPATPVPPAPSDSDKPRNMSGSSRSPGLPQLPPVLYVVTPTERPKDVSQSASNTFEVQPRTSKPRTGAAQGGLADAGTADRQNSAATQAAPLSSQNPSDKHGNQNTQDDYLQATKESPTRSPVITSQQADIPQTAAVAKSENSPVAPNVDQNTRIASGSVAINTRFLSIRAPRGLTTQASQLGATLEIGQLISSPQPVYPPEAARQRIEGTVTLHAVVGGDGKVESVEPISGPSVLLAPAMNAVRDWRYGQTLIDGKPIESVRNIDLVFRLLN